MSDIVALDDKATPLTPAQKSGISRALTRSDRLFLQAYSSCDSLLEAGFVWAELRGDPINGGREDARARDVASATACRKLFEIRKKVERNGDPEMFWEYLGLGASTIAKAYGAGMQATMVKPMVVRSDRVVTMTNLKGESYDRVITEEAIQEAGPYIDHPTRVDAARSAARLRGDERRSIAALPGAGDDEDRKPVTYIFNILGPTAVKAG